MTDTTEAVDESDGHDTSDGPSRLGRRCLMGLAAGGVGAAAGLGVGLAVADSAGATERTLTFDVACDGPTFRALDLPFIWPQVFADRDAQIDDGDFRGSPFSVEGWIYPEGTIQGAGFVPVADGAIGHWFCRGHLIINPGRPEPHLMSHQEYVLGMITPDELFPPTMLCSVGLESSNEGTQSGHRAVYGGTGEYMGASGEVEQVDLGPNTSILFGDTFPAPSFRFHFDLRLP